MGKLDQADTLYQQCIEILEKIYQKDSFYSSYIYQEQSKLLYQKDQVIQAIDLAEKSLDIC